MENTFGMIVAVVIVIVVVVVGVGVVTHTHLILDLLIGYVPKPHSRGKLFLSQIILLPIRNNIVTCICVTIEGVWIGGRFIDHL
jgi:hypothetical protein